MSELIEQARREGKWLRCAYQDLWLSPDELVKAQANGMYRWGPANWELRDPQVRLDYLNGKVDSAIIERNMFKARMAVAAESRR